MHEYYDFLDTQINESIHADIGFTLLAASTPYTMLNEETHGFFKRYTTIRAYQQICQELFTASLQGQCDPEIAKLIINELPAGQGLQFHQRLGDLDLMPPVFFRTDEVIPGKISEIQCPGSLWGMHEQLYHFYTTYAKKDDHAPAFPQSLASLFARSLKEYLPEEPILHHLLDNASVPAGIRYFIQQTRERGGMRYFGYDKGVTPYDCNFIRSHAFAGLLSDNHFKYRLKKCAEGKLRYDLPPSVLFDEKLALIFPFWEKTQAHFSDEIRDLFPYTALITPQGFSLEDGQRITLEEFMKRPRSQRSYYIKYAGSDLALNWGSKGVYYGASLSKTKAHEVVEHIHKGYANKQYWVIQKGYEQKEMTVFMDRASGTEKTSEVHSKFSGFYGPQGLLGILVMQRPFYKVHGATNTIASIVT